MKKGTRIVASLSAALFLVVVTPVNGKRAVPVARIHAALDRSSHTWEVVQSDKTPSVAVEGHSGYRVLLCQTWKQPVATQQAANTVPETQSVTRYTHVDLILFPEEEQLPADFTSRLPWLEAREDHYSRAFSIGRGLGFTWFASCPVIWQEVLRDKLGLKGGEDRLKILVDALEINDSGEWTANSVPQLIGRSGDEAVPYLQAAIRKHQGDNAWRQVTALGEVQGERSTQLLRKLYASKNKAIRDAAAEALVHRPYRKAAKNEYFDMLRRQSHAVGSAADACVEFGWRDAMPLFREVCARPVSWGIFRTVFESRRRMEGQPIAEELLEAERELYSGQPATVEHGRATLLGSSDKEAAAVIALSAALKHGKGSTQWFQAIHEAGRDVFRRLPEDITKPLLSSLRSIQVDVEKSAIADLLAAT
jgi:hypothetical protein